MSHQSELIAQDIEAYLRQHEQKELLRLLTCGSVDDGKSTLIGRLLHDSKMIYEDQLDAIRNDSRKSGTTGEAVDLALLVDGLQAEREQGITIDVAYRYFSTARRKFIIADTPGHEQYTRNMATGASTCDLAIILIDARHGVQTQTKRHSFIASLLGIRHVIVAVNKMDLVDFSQQRFEEIRKEYLAFTGQLKIPDLHFIPLSALNGDNVVHPSDSTPWYDGLPLMELLETVEIGGDTNLETFRMPVQYVNRPNLNFRGYCGTIASGVVHPGDAICVLPSGKTSRIKSIVSYEGELNEAFAPMAVTLTLADEIDISRGDLLIHPEQRPAVGQRFAAHLVWMNEQALLPGREYYLKHNTRTVIGQVTEISHRIDVNTLDAHPGGDRLSLNEIALCELAVQSPLAFDAYADNPGTGAFILIDRINNLTVGAGMITQNLEEGDTDQELPALERAEREARFRQRSGSVALTGAAAGLAEALERRLFSMGHNPVLITPSQWPDLQAIGPALAAWAHQKGQLLIVADEAAESWADAHYQTAKLADLIAALQRDHWIEAAQ